ncbi:MAG: AtpZ/AtpI family protein [candidate division Zixibacteria bacterium]|nr:AtpZ/AtpI family protein [candidate division Zixibacteria bacterium]
MEQKSDNQNTSRKPVNQMGFGMAIGVGIGTALGVALDQLAMGVALGVALGTAWGGFHNYRCRKKEISKGS